jgi:hypothetical protein
MKKKTKKTKKVKPVENVDKLNLRREMFCQLYVIADKDFFGNGVQCYLEAYPIDRSKPNWYKTACVDASRLLSNAKVCDRINELLESGGLNDQFADKQLLFLITQHSDFNAKMSALREYNKLKQRIIEKQDVTSGGKRLDYKEITYDDVIKRLRKNDRSTNPV